MTLEIPPPLPKKVSIETVKYCFWLALFLISAMSVITIQGQEYPPFFETTAGVIIGAIIGALKLQQ
jgi:hypothetical protein